MYMGVYTTGIHEERFVSLQKPREKTCKYFIGAYVTPSLDAVTGIFRVTQILMPLILASPGHQQLWNLPYMINETLSFIRKDFTYLTCWGSNFAILNYYLCDTHPMCADDKTICRRIYCMMYVLTQGSIRWSGEGERGWKMRNIPWQNYSGVISASAKQFIGVDIISIDTLMQMERCTFSW